VWRLREINKKMENLKAFFLENDLAIKEDNVKSVLRNFLELKTIMKNIDNNFHYLASLAPKSYLKSKHGVEISLEKATGEGGLDIETGDVVGEIRTTVPCGKGDFGANQKINIRKDLTRLKLSKAKHKYFFVIDKQAEHILRRKYSKNYPAVTIVNLLE